MTKLESFKQEYQRLHDMIDGKIDNINLMSLLANCGRQADELIVELPDSTPFEDKKYMVEALEFLHGLAGHLLTNLRQCLKN